MEKGAGPSLAPPAAAARLRRPRAGLDTRGQWAPGLCGRGARKRGERALSGGCRRGTGGKASGHPHQVPRTPASTLPSVQSVRHGRDVKPPGVGASGRRDGSPGRPRVGLVTGPGELVSGARVPQVTACAAEAVGGGEEGRGGCRGRGAPPGRKLNINQSIAVSPATQQRRGCGGGRGTGQERVRGKEEGGGGRESAMGGRCGEDRTRGAVEDGWQRTECRARRWPRPTGGCSRCKRAPGPGVWSSSSLWVQGAAASPSP